MLVHESSQYDHSNSGDDGQGEVLDKAKEWALKKIISSKDMTDRRLVNMVRI